MKRRWLIGAAAGLLGCDRPAAAPPTTPASAPAATAPPTQPPGPGVLMLDERKFVFPPSRLILDNTEDGVRAVLTSLETGARTDDPEQLNTVFLEMILTPPAGGSISGAVWDYKATSRTREESSYGILLNRRNWVLQPYDVHAILAGDVSPVVIQISGSFLLFDEETEPDIPQELQLTAEFPAELRVKSSAAGK